MSEQTELTEQGKQIRRELRGDFDNAEGFSCVEILLAIHHHVIKKQDAFILSTETGRLPLYKITQRTRLDPFLQGPGHGISVAVEKASDAEHRVFVLMSKGECEMGSTWVGLLRAGQDRLDNLIAVVDWPDGPVTNLNTALPEAAHAAGWHVTIVDGHSIKALTEVLSLGLPRPHLVIARTEKDRGLEEQ